MIYMTSEKYYSYNEIINPKIKKINENLDMDIQDISPLKYSELLNKDKYLNPCRLLWASYKIQNNLDDSTIKKKIVGARRINKIDGFIRYAKHLDARLEYYIKKMRDVQKDKIVTKKSILDKINSDIHNKCTIDILSNNNNIFTKSMISQLALVPGKDNKGGLKQDNLYETINEYSDSEFININGGLRGFAKLSTTTINNIINLDMIFDYFASTSVLNNDPIRLYRGMSQVFYERNGVPGNTMIMNDLQVGDIINDKGYVSASLDINTSLNPDFFQRNVSNDNIWEVNTSPCCCLFTFLYPPHLPFIMMGDFNIGEFFEDYQLKDKTTMYGFSETEILLPRNFTFRVKNKLQVKNILYMDGNKEEKFTDINLIVCEVVYKLSDAEYKSIKQKNNALDTSFLIYKSNIINRNKCPTSNVGLCGPAYNTYLKEYERKINKFNMKATWFDGNVGIKYVLSPKPLIGGYYDKYIKYKDKYIDLKKSLEGGAKDQVNVIKKSLQQQIDLMSGIIFKSKCCEKKIGAFKENNKKNKTVAKLYESFENLQKENNKVWNSSFDIKNTDNTYNAWKEYIDTTNDFDLLDDANTKLMNRFIYMINNYIFFLDEYLLDKDIINLKKLENGTQICINCNNAKCTLNTNEYYDAPVDVHQSIKCRNMGEGKQIIDVCCNLNNIDQYCMFNFDSFINKLPKIYDDMIKDMDPKKTNRYKMNRDLLIDMIGRIKIMYAKMKIDTKKIV